MQRAYLRQFSWGGLFSLGFAANVGVWIPVGVLFGLAALFGYNTVRWNNIPVHGLSGFALSIFISVLAICFGTLLFVAGAKIASLFSNRLPAISIRPQVEIAEGGTDVSTDYQGRS